MASATTGRWAGQRERRRAEFIDAALVVIEQHGPQTSTEQIAAHVGVSRTKLYRHFVDAADLQREVAHRTAQMITAELAPVWQPEGSMAQIVKAGVSAHVHFLTQHPNLYRYLQRCLIDEGFNAFADIKITIANLLTAVLKVYVAAFDAAVEYVAEAPKIRFTCTDPDDQHFLDLASQHKALLVSKDRAVLKQRKRVATHYGATVGNVVVMEEERLAA